MSKMKSDRRPPLAKSPIRLRPRRVLQSSSSSVQTPPGSLTKSQKPNLTREMEESDLRSENHTMSCELRALARMVQDELGNASSTSVGLSNNSSTNSSPLFERGRFYEVYSARRNERLKRKKGETEEEGKTPYHLGVTVESSKKRDSKKLESLRKSVSAAYSVERSANPRYSLRSLSKENKKPPLPFNVEKSVCPSERKVGTRRVRKI
ncbi:hypothetical protein JCGZ_08089 [Jatropha curcas]|uniref:Uncharacterized protein n=1 Tax=Jatropha curcas TaxID=180498 RepID=A0A067KP87_JATCU|nr:uncharacterized protein LOC105635235 [Jatropha curcas]KDP36798.1 hypothetical protein JCGZ_08089 [Jatropha curcas]